MSGKPQKVKTWTVVRSFSFMGNRDPGEVQAAFGAVGQAIATQLAQKAAPDVSPAVLQQPITVDEVVVVGTRSAVAPIAAVMAFVSQQTTFIPIVLFIVIIFAAQMIATAIATEKENKTLETLLSYPISRASIVTSKMVAAGLVALLSAAAYMIGLRQYMSGIETGLGDERGGTAAARAQAASEAAMQSLGLTFSPTDYALLGLTLFAGILVALAIAIILGAFAESVKSVQAMLTPLMVLLLVPYFLTLFLDLGDLPSAVRFVVMAIPFTYPFITGPALFLGNYGLVWFGIVYQLVWFAIFVAIAARIFSTDRVLTMKLSLGKRRRRSVQADGSQRRRHGSHRPRRAARPATGPGVSDSSNTAVEADGHPDVGEREHRRCERRAARATARRATQPPRPGRRQAPPTPATSRRLLRSAARAAVAVATGRSDRRESCPTSAASGRPRPTARRRSSRDARQVH